MLSVCNRCLSEYAWLLKKLEHTECRIINRSKFVEIRSQVSCYQTILRVWVCAVWLCYSPQISRPHTPPTHTLTHTLLFSINLFSEKRENPACFGGEYRQTSKEGFMLPKRLQARTYVTLVSMFRSPHRFSSFDIKISFIKKQARLACVAAKKGPEYLSYATYPYHCNE
jgi:hypothetical protein